MQQSLNIKRMFKSDTQSTAELHNGVRKLYRISKKNSLMRCVSNAALNPCNYIQRGLMGLRVNKYKLKSN